MRATYTLKHDPHPEREAPPEARRYVSALLQTQRLEARPSLLSGPAARPTEQLRALLIGHASWALVERELDRIDRLVQRVGALNGGAMGVAAAPRPRGGD